MNINQLTQALNFLKPGRVVGSKNITIGLANTSYLIITDSRERYVIRQLRVQSPDSARTDAQLQSLLNKGGVLSPEYLVLKTGDVVGQVDDLYFTISAFLSGTTPIKVTLKLAKSFGSTLAKIHSAFENSQTIVQPNRAQWLMPSNSRQDIKLCPNNLRERLSIRLDASESILHSELPMALIHADLFPENTFAEDDELKVVFDLETVEYTTRLLDIARTYISFAYDKTLDKSLLKSALLDGYNGDAKARITNKELTMFPLAVEYTAVACAAWLHNNDGEEFVEPYLEIGADLYAL